MALVVGEIDYQTAIKTIRELVLDINPVSCLIVKDQGLVFSKVEETVTINADSFSITETPKFYSFVNKLRELGISDYQTSNDYAPLEGTEGLEDFSFDSNEGQNDVGGSVNLQRLNYFTITTIEQLMVEYFSYYLTFDGITRTTLEIFNCLEFQDRRKLIFWVAYYLVDKKRSYYASISGENGTPNTDDQYRDSKKNITTRIGDVYTVVENELDETKGEKGFTSFWGDKYSYYAKLQLYIRDRFERQFRDFSLREDAMVTTQFAVDKVWTNEAWYDTLDLSQSTYSILDLDYRL